VDSTPMAEQLDPEELREVISEYQEASAEVIQRFEGHIAQYLGDGLLVYFGFPLAHEDDAQRAVRAGLGIVAAVQELNTRLQQRKAYHAPPLRVRIGIHTGLVVVGEIGGGEKKELMALGEAPNVAARLQGLAEPGTVVISAATHRLVEGYFVLHPLGSHKLKGVSAPLQVYRVLGESETRSRVEIAAASGLTPLVGREHEVRLLLERWGQVQEGLGQAVLLSGEAGIGKSRLVRALKERLTEESHTWLECRCSPYHQNSALYPVIDLLQRVLQFKREDTPEEKLSKLEGALGLYGFSLQETVPLLATLLSLPVTRYPLPPLSPQKQKQKTLEIILAWLLKEAERRPLLFVVEDLHWIDPSTLELLDLLIDQVPAARILLLLTFRPEFLPPWSSRSHLTLVTLGRLARKQAEVMVEQVTKGKELPPEVFQQVVAKTDGVPLFVEELTKMVLESGFLREEDGHYELLEPLPSLAIPTTLHDSLMARLDRLSTVKETAQLGATLGREFTYELLQAVSPLDDAALQRDLERLVKAELLYQRGLPPQARYIFKHVLIQEVAYQSLLKSRRQQYHHKIAQTLTERFAETAETQPELLAHHYTEAGLLTQAIPSWQKAGEKAMERSAHKEAISHFTRGLELLAAQPETPERNQQELALQIALGGPLTATTGYAAAQVEKAYARALELCRQLGETLQLVRVLGGLEAFYFVRGELQTARELGEQLLRLAQNVQDPALFLRAHTALGLALFHLGALTQAQEHLGQGIALHDSQKRRSHALQDPEVVFLSYAALVLWHLGYPDQAQKKIHEALTLARELSHPYSLALALYFSASLHQFRREGRATQEQAEAVIALATEQGFSFLLAHGTTLRGWALAEQGQGREGIAQMQQGLAAYQATGSELFRPYYLALLAEGYGRAEQTAEGLVALSEALAAVHKNGEHVYEAMLHRLQGQLTLQKFQVSSSKFQVPNTQHPTPSTQAEAEAEACFLKAVAIARQQEAKSLELRAATSLAYLWQRQGKQHAARNTLSEIYSWFTEGFDTVDLREAKALLRELSY
jgi:TOMM system kinase/cyclase fusion protein